MKSNIVPATVTSVSSPLTTALPTAKIVRHPKAKKLEEEHPSVQPDEETLLRLNAMAKKYPFCILHRGNNHSWLL